jgi:hypothetical protein
MQYLAIFALLFLVISTALAGCSSEVGDPNLVKNTYLELVDWHISGFWIINCPVAWVRIKNCNAKPITEITLQYNTYTIDGRPLNEGTFPIENSTLRPGELHNFAELYLGLVDLESEKLTVRIVSVSPG